MLYRRLFSCKSKLTMIVGTNDDNDDHDDNAPKEDEIGTRKKKTWKPVPAPNHGPGGLNLGLLGMSLKISGNPAVLLPAYS